MSSDFDEERLKFEGYLIETFGYSKKVAKDYASRCKRIERDVRVDLSLAVSNAARYEKLLGQIQVYAITVRKEKKSAYSLTAMLRAAAKKYALYLYPKKATSYPSAHGTSQYFHKSND